MKGRRHEGFLSLETIETWIVSVCNLEGEWARQKIKCLSVLRTATLLGFSRSKVFSEREKPSSVAVLDTLKPVCLAPSTRPCSKALKYVVLPIHPLNVTQRIHVYIFSSIKILL